MNRFVLTHARPEQGRSDLTRHAWTATAMMLLLYIISWADKAVIGVAGQSLIEDLQMTDIQFGFVGSAFYFLFSLSCLYVGFVADRLPLKWVLFGMCAIWSLTQIPVLMSATFTALLVSRIALGAAEGPSSSLAHVTTYTWFPTERRGLPAGIITSGASIAKMTLGPLLAVIVAMWSWHAAFAVLAVVGLAWCVVWAVTGGTGPYAAVGDHSHTPRRPLRRILASPTFVGCSIGYFGHYALAAVVLTWLPTFLEKVHGYSRAGSGAMLALPSAFAVAALIGIGFLTDHLTRRGWSAGRSRGLLGGSLVAAGGLLVVIGAVVPDAVLSIVLLSLGYGVGASVYSLANPAAAQLVGPEQRSGVVGAMTALGSLGGVLGPVATGWTLDLVGNPAGGFLAVFAGFGGLLAVCAVVFALTVRPDRDFGRLVGAVSDPAPAGRA